MKCLELLGILISFMEKGERILTAALQHLSALPVQLLRQVSSLGARARGGVVRRRRSVLQVVVQGSGLIGQVWSRQGTSGSRMVPYGSVYQLYINTGQSSDPSGPVGACRVILVGSDGFPLEP